jgi:hypothetical protein
MDQNDSQRFGISRFKNGGKEFEYMQVHVTQSKTGHIEDDASLVTGRLDQHAHALKCVENVHFQGLPWLLVRIVQPDFNGEDRASFPVNTSDEALSTPILVHETLLLGGWQFLQTNSLPLLNNVLFYACLLAPSHSGHEHSHTFLDVPFACTEESKDQGVRMFNANAPPQELAEVAKSDWVEVTHKLFGIFRAI